MSCYFRTLLCLFVLGLQSILVQGQSTSPTVVKAIQKIKYSAEPPSTSTAPTTSKSDSRTPIWYYITGGSIGIGLFCVFCFGVRQLKMRLCPQFAYNKVFRDLVKVSKHLPEHQRENIEALQVLPLRKRENEYKAYTVEESASAIVFDPWEVAPEDLHVSATKLGSGAYATVFKGVLRGVPPVIKLFPGLRATMQFNADENEVAVKMVHAYASNQDKQDLISEIEFMKTLDVHPHILCMLGCSKESRSPFIISELCSHGDLLTLLRRTSDGCGESCLEESELPSIAWQVADALTYLSSRSMIHRDVAARNVLLTDHKMAKLSDFGLCRLSNEMFYTTKGGKLPIKWMAPESLEKAIFSEKTDVWSFGVLLYEVFTFGKSPFMTVDAEDMLQHLRDGNRLELDADSPGEIRCLLAECLALRAESRPAFASITSKLYAFIESSGMHGYLECQKNYYDYRTVRRCDADAGRNKQD